MSKQPPVVGGPSVADSADQVLFGVQYLLTTRGIQRGELTADTAYVLDDQNRFDLRKAHVDLHHRDRRAAGHDGRATAACTARARRSSRAGATWWSSSSTDAR